MSINSINLTGNLTKDIEVRTTQSGMPIGSFVVVANERKKQGEEWIDYPNYIPCKLFGRRADSLAPYLIKGSKVAITGKLHQNRWEADGEKRSSIEVHIDNIDLCGGKRERTETPSASISEDAYYDEDIPF